MLFSYCKVSLIENYSFVVAFFTANVDLCGGLYASFIIALYRLFLDDDDVGGGDYFVLGDKIVVSN